MILKRKVKRIKYNSCWHYIEHLVDIKCKPAFLDSKRYISHKSKNKCKRIVEVINKSCYIVSKPKKKVKKSSFKVFKYSFANHYGSASCYETPLMGSKLSRTSNQSNETYLKFDISMMKEIRSKQMSLTYFGSSSLVFLFFLFYFFFFA